MATPPSWAVPKSGGTPAPAPTAPKPAPSGGIGGFVSKVVSGAESFVGGLFGAKKAAPATAPSAPAWAVAKSAASTPAATSATSSTTPTPTPAAPTSAPGPTTPSWAVPQGGAPDNTQKKSDVSDGDTPFGNLFQSPDLSVNDSTAQMDSGPDPIATLAQGLPRDAATIGVSAGQAVANMISPKLGAAADISIDPSKMGPLGRIVLGSEPITGLADTAASYEQSIKSSTFAKEYGLDKYATPLAIGGAVVPVSLDFLGLGGEENAVTALAKASSIEEVAPILRQIGVHEDLIPSVAEKLAGITDKKEVKSALDSIDALQKSTTVHTPGDTETSVHDVPSGEDVLPKEKVDPLDPNAEKPAPAAEEAPAKTHATEPPRPVDEVEKDLEEAIFKRSFISDVAADHPGRALAKYRSNATGELPEIRGRKGPALGANGKPIKDTRGAFNKRGDDILQDALGQEESEGGDIDIGNQRLAEYTQVRDQLRAEDENIRALRAELRESKAQEALQEESQRATTRIEKGSRSVREPRTKAERQEGTPGDYLRRGAEVVRSGRTESVAEPMAKGIARESWQKAAVAETLYGDIEKGPFKGWSTRLRNWYQDWVYARQAVGVETKVALKPFEVLKSAKMDWVYEYLGRGIKDGRVVEGSRSRYGMFGQVEKQLSRWLDEEQAAGIKVAEKDNYLPIYLKNAAEESEGELNGRRLGLRPGFSLQSDFKDYVEAIEAGYKPKYDTMYDILQARARAHFKAMADANMFRKGVGEGWIVPKPAVSDDMRSEFRDLSSERFPTQRAAYGNTIYNGVYSAPEAVAQKINNYLADPDKFLSKASGFARTVKNTALSVGLPGTGLSIHFWNVLPREVALDFALSPVRAPYEAAKYMYYAINPRAAQRFIDTHLADALPLVRAGMKMSSEEHNPFKTLGDAFAKDAEGKYQESVPARAGAAYKSMSDWLHKLFGGNTFDKLLPARKMGNGLRLMETYQKHGYSADEAARMAASDINAVYGGINWESLGRSRNWQGIFQTIAMAPDYAETNLKLGARGVKAFTSPRSIQSKIYRGMMYFYAASYLTSNLINHENSGHWMPENDLLHQFSIDLGKDTNGKERYFNIYGTGVDFLRLPLYVATAISKGNLQDLNSVLLNRLSIPVRSVLSLLLNVDWKGDPIFGPDNYGRPQSAGEEAANVESNTIGDALPGSLGSLGDLVSGRVSKGEAALEAVGLPFTEKNIQPTTADINALKAQASEDIRNGDYTLYQKLVTAGAIPSRSRATFIRTALTQAKTPAQQRSAASAAAKTAAEKSALQDEGFTNSQ